MLYKSEDFGATWAAGVPVHQDCSGYSSVVLIGKKMNKNTNGNLSENLSENLSQTTVGVAWSTAGLMHGGPLLFRRVSIG